MEPIRPVDLGSYLSEPSEPELELTRLFRPSASIVIFDIGACEGEDSIRYARRFPRSRVFSFEPVPQNQAVIRENFARYQARNAELVPLALTDDAGPAAFHLSSGRPPREFAGPDWNYGNKSGSLLPPAGAGPMHGWIEFRENITVPTTTLAEFCASRGLPRVDFIHLDVQGAEKKVLLGAGSLLRRVRAVWLEVAEIELYSGQAVRNEIEALMRGAGFVCTRTTMRVVEGDQFYVNTRDPALWPYLAATGCHRFVQRLWRLSRTLLRNATGRSDRHP